MLALRFKRSLLALSMLSLVFSISLIASTASATVMKYVGLEELIEISDIIVEGSVAEQKVYFDEAQGRVVTDTTFKVKRNFMGKADDTVTIQQWKGTHKGITSQIPGDPKFEKGESVIVFLHRGADGVVALSAMAQSKFSLFPSAQGKLVSRNFSDLSILLDDAALKKLAAPSAMAPSAGQLVKLPKETRSYESFVAELESLIAGIKGGSND
ncbi:hypothetical protein DN745_14555 [Bradymonas sediminis]|uniref:Uncharacterized protein n=2 Tax=Bradymonas sediminis TaxID=1548548 RepID=A0A2Z4FNG3_9DELT|nr:hypothetical protein DN745_14555 [Bradymonas sediminis]